MIDVEVKVFDRVKKAVLEAYPEVFVSGEYIRTDSIFPALTLMEMGNSVNTNASSLTDIENMVDLMYEINVYSNKTTGKKSEAKAILKVADEQMLAMGFIRTTLTPMANIDNATIYRIVARYEKLENGGL